jgi:hypothetical protein
VVKALLDKYPELLNRSTKLLLHIAVENDHLGVALQLLSKQSSLKTPFSSHFNDSGENPLHLAAKLGNETMVKMLLRNRFPINSPTSTGFSALMIASYADKKDVVEVLLQNGADKEKSVGGKNAISFAKEGSEVYTLLTLPELVPIPGLSAAALGEGAGMKTGARAGAGAGSGAAKLLARRAPAGVPAMRGGGGVGVAPREESPGTAVAGPEVAGPVAARKAADEIALD